MMHQKLFHLVVATEGNALVTGLPGTGKTSLIKWSLRDIPPDFAVVVYDTVGDFRECDFAGRYSVNPMDLQPSRFLEILEEALSATYGEYAYLLTPAMAELITRAIENGAETPSAVRSMVYKIAEAHEVDTAHAVRRRLAHLDYPQFLKSDVPIKPGKSTCVDISALDRVGRMAFVLTHLELTRRSRNVIYVIDEAHRFLAFANRYSLLVDHLRTGRAMGRFFVLVSHSFGEFRRHLGYVKMSIRFLDWDWESDKMPPLGPSEALVTLWAASTRSAAMLSKMGIPLAGGVSRFKLQVPPYAAGSPA
ncbi:MAG: AAA family ATPase [Pyrobaculum sp.]